MVSQIPKEIHIITQQFPPQTFAISKYIRCQKWSSICKSDNFYLYDSYRSRRQTNLLTIHNICNILLKYLEQAFGSHIIYFNEINLTYPPKAINTLTAQFRRFLDRLITGKEKWLLCDNPKHKR